MTITINGTSGITTPEVILDNTSADGGQVVLKSSGYSDWNLDNYSGRLRAYYGSTEYFTVTNSGNVGIGTSLPAQKLHVYGSGAIFSQVESSTATSMGLILKNSVRQYNMSVGSGGNWSIYDASASADRIVIDTNGYLLVGTTSTGGNNVGFRIYGSYGSINSVTNTAEYSVFNKSTSTTGTQIQFRSADTSVGSISSSSTATTYSTSSDYRLKENVQPMTGALSVVQALKPCTYNWKADGSDGQGFIAHELAEVVPDCVTGEKDAVDENGNPVYQGIDTSFLVATLTAAIQELAAASVEQQAIIQTLTSRIEALENK